jgi:hypothetical protein
MAQVFGNPNVWLINHVSEFPKLSTIFDLDFYLEVGLPCKFLPLPAVMKLKKQKGK